MFPKLWMVGVQKMPHSNQDTQMGIESYHGVLKYWFALDTRGLRGHRIDWLVWRLTTTIAHHYMHTLEMKKKGLIKNKVMEVIITWGVRSQCLPNVMYVMKFPFTKIFCYTCEWALRGNMCKHQIVVILTCIDIFQKNIIH
jgi:hypothetical protein